MWVVSKAALRKFWQSAGGDAARVREALEEWYDFTAGADWDMWSAVKETHAGADKVGDCVVFNVLNNDYRLIARVRFRTHKVYILRVMTHKEYDRNLWPGQCGCHQPPPPRRPGTPRPTKRGN